ncbi:unnamed protein product [Brassica oleracea]
MSLIHLFFFVGLVSLEAAAATSFSLGSRSILRDIGSNVIADQKDNTVEPNAINFDSVFQDTSAKFAVLEFFAHCNLSEPYALAEANRDKGIRQTEIVVATCNIKSTKRVNESLIEILSIRSPLQYGRIAKNENCHREKKKKGRTARNVQLGRAYSIATLVRSYYPSELNSYFSSRGEGTKGLVQFSDIGKQARDLLFTDYQQGLKASLNFDPYRIRLRSSVDAGGLSGGLVASFPDQSSSKVSLGYVHPNAIANFTTSFGLFRNPLFALSEVVGNHLWSLGFDASFDVTTQSFRSMDFASSLISDKFIASFNSYNRADLLKVYLYQSVMNSAYAVELSRQRSTNTSRISIGYEHRFGSEVLVKSRVDSNGTVAALFQYKWNPGTFYSYNRRADLLKVYLHQSVMNSAYAVELSRQRSTNTNQD